MLISMFVMMIGLLGVAALIPAGNHEIAEGVKLETAAMIGRSAFRDLNVRGMLNPRGIRPGQGVNALDPPTSFRDGWYSAAGIYTGSSEAVWDPTINPPAPFKVATSTPSTALSPAYAIDPLGIIAGYGNQFPYGAPTNQMFLTRVSPMNRSVPGVDLQLQSIFRIDNDLLLQPNQTSKDLPPTQMWSTDTGNYAVGRNFDGNYSWMATVVGDSNLPSAYRRVTVSVVVFYKRNLSTAGAGELRADASLTGGGVSGGEVTLANFTSSASPAPTITGVKPGQWIMLAASKQVPDPSTGLNVNLNYFRWYRVLSAAAFNASGNIQTATLSGSDFPPGPYNVGPQAWVFDNIVNVYEKQLSLELN